MAEMIDERMSADLEELGLRVEEIAEPVTHAVPQSNAASLLGTLDALTREIRNSR